MQSDDQKASQMWVNLFSVTSRVRAASGQRCLLEEEKLQNKLENKWSHEVIHVICYLKCQKPEEEDSLQQQPYLGAS